MPGLTAGLVRVHNVVTLGASANSGPLLLEAAWYTKWTFQVRSSGTVTTPSILFQGTTDPATAGKIGVPGSAVNSNWFNLVPPSETGTVVVNPITAVDGTQSMKFDLPLLAVRYTTNAFTGGGSVIIEALVAP